MLADLKKGADDHVGLKCFRTVAVECDAKPAYGRWRERLLSQVQEFGKAWRTLKWSATMFRPEVKKKINFVNLVSRESVLAKLTNYDITSSNLSVYYRYIIPTAVFRSDDIKRFREESAVHDVRWKLSSKTEVCIRRPLVNRQQTQSWNSGPKCHYWDGIIHLLKDLKRICISAFVIFGRTTGICVVKEGDTYRWIDGIDMNCTVVSVVAGRWLTNVHSANCLYRVMMVTLCWDVVKKLEWYTKFNRRHFDFVYSVTHPPISTQVDNLHSSDMLDHIWSRNLSCFDRYTYFTIVKRVGPGTLLQVQTWRTSVSFATHAWS